MKEIAIIGIDLAKRVFQLHGAAADGSVVFRKKLSRTQLLAFLAKVPACTIAMEACATSHHWGREIEKLGHAVRLIPPIYVKPFVKRQKNDAADAEAIAEAASRPTMRFVALKTEEQQSRAMIFRARDLLVRQRTQLINALRGHLAEYGVVAAQGIIHAKRLQKAIDDPETGLPPLVRDIGRSYLDQIAGCSERIAELEKTLRTEAAQSETTARLQTMPGVGPIGAMAIEALRAADAKLPTRSRLRCLAGSGASTEIDRRQADSGEDLEDGPARYPQAAYHRRHGRRALGDPQRCARGLVAGAHAGAQAAHGCRDRARQQDGAVDLGHAGEAGGLTETRWRLRPDRPDGIGTSGM